MKKTFQDFMGNFYGYYTNLPYNVAIRSIAYELYLLDVFETGRYDCILDLIMYNELPSVPENYKGHYENL